MDKSPTAVAQTPAQPINFKSGFYWAKRVSFRPYAKPVIVSVQDGRISMKTKEAVIFDVPISSITVKFTTGFSLSMQITVDNITYIFVGTPGDFYPKFSTEQLAELNQAAAPGDTMRQGSGAFASGSVVRSASPASPEVRAIGATGQAIGAAAELMAVYDVEKLLKTWQAVFASNGVIVTDTHGTAITATSDSKNFHGLNIALLITGILVAATLVVDIGYEIVLHFVPH